MRTPVTVMLFTCLVILSVFEAAICSPEIIKECNEKSIFYYESNCFPDSNFINLIRETSSKHCEVVLTNGVSLSGQIKIFEDGIILKSSGAVDMNNLSGSSTNISARFKWEEIAKIKLMLPRTKKPGDLVFGFVIGVVSAGVWFVAAILN